MTEGAARCPANVIVPVILLPGIMGSRLTSSAGVVWDPDDSFGMLRQYGTNGGVVAGPDLFRIRETANVREAAAARKARLIGTSFNKNFLRPIEFTAVEGLTQAQVQRNWSSVALSSYGQILRDLEGRFPAQLTNRLRESNPRFNLVKMPVYACGYNWSASNHDSGRAAAAHIKTWVAEARAWAAKNNAQCPGAILVTHSMGGFVARSAALSHGAAADILCVISTVMPTDGAPAAYKRFHFGFENPTAGEAPSLKDDVFAHGGYVVLGRQGALVTALLGHMPGAQELLPNRRYRSNDGSRQWLHILNPERNMIGNMISGGAGHLHLPESNPYTEIYRRADRMYRAANPAWLFPDGLASGNPFEEFLRHNETAEAWHNTIESAGDFHELTYICHSGDIRMLTYDFISWRPDMTGGSLGRSVSEDNLVVSDGNTPDYRREHLIWGSEEDKYINGGWLGFGTSWTIRPASGSGDRTVPVSASTPRISHSRRFVHAKGYEHEAAIRNTEVINWIRDTMISVLSQCELY